MKNAFIAAHFLAAGLALAATGRQPYNFYVLTRWTVFLVCCWGVWEYRNHVRPWMMVSYIALGVIFNPIHPFRFKRERWEWIDLGAAMALTIKGVVQTKGRKDKHL